VASGDSGITATATTPRKVPHRESARHLPPNNLYCGINPLIIHVNQSAWIQLLTFIKSCRIGAPAEPGSEQFNSIARRLLRCTKVKQIHPFEAEIAALSTEVSAAELVELHRMYQALFGELKEIEDSGGDVGGDEVSADLRFHAELIEPTVVLPTTTNVDRIQEEEMVLKTTTIAATNCPMPSPAGLKSQELMKPYSGSLYRKVSGGAPRFTLTPTNANQPGRVDALPPRSWLQNDSTVVTDSPGTVKVMVQGLACHVIPCGRTTVEPEMLCDPIDFTVYSTHSFVPHVLPSTILSLSTCSGVETSTSMNLIAHLSIGLSFLLPTLFMVVLTLKVEPGCCCSQSSDGGKGIVRSSDSSRSSSSCSECLHLSQQQQQQQCWWY
jgi:hypothetical protein